MLGKVFEVVMNLLGLIKGFWMSKIIDIIRLLGLGVVFEKVVVNNLDGFVVIYCDCCYIYC